MIVNLDSYWSKFNIMAIILPTPLVNFLTSARDGYPLQLMVFYQLSQWCLFQKENPPRKHPYNLVGMISRFILSYVCYCYPSTIVIEPVFLGRYPTMMTQPAAMAIWAILLAIGHFERLDMVYKWLNSPWIQYFSRWVFWVDQTRIGFNMLEA